MEQYLSLVDRILKEGVWKNNRTGVRTKVIDGADIKHNMSEGYPLLTTKKMAYISMMVELEGFIKAKTDKKWYQDRKCKIWNNWARRDKVPYGNDEETKKIMYAENDLGPIYGFIWRHFGAEYTDCHKNYSGKGFDQLRHAIETLRKNPDDRKQVVSAWDPINIPKMANDPCHYSFHLTTTEGKLNLFWNQRSIDTMIGLPFNIASYALLLHLIAKELNLNEGKLVGHLNDVQIYENHIEGAKEQIKRTPKPLPKIITHNFKSIDDWKYTDTEVVDYAPHPPIKFDVAV